MSEEVTLVLSTSVEATSICTRPSDSSLVRVYSHDVSNLNNAMFRILRQIARRYITSQQRGQPPGFDDGLPAGQRAVVVVHREQRAQPAPARARPPRHYCAPRPRGGRHQHRVLERLLYFTQILDP